MSRSGHDARKPPAPRSRASGFDDRMAMRLVRLGMVRHVLRSRRFYERVALGVIVLRALRQMGEENRASTMARLAAWNKREIQRLEHKAEQQAHAVKGAEQMVRSEVSKELAKKMHEI